jgi:hypothetical protein
MRLVLRYHVYSSRVALCRNLFLILCFFFVAIASAVPNVNNWIKPGSGAWEESSSWSLGVLPNQSQSVYITNSGWKAVAIWPVTAQNFAQSLNVESVVVRGYTDSFNVLLLNYAGTAFPLRATNGVHIDAGE